MARAREKKRKGAASSRGSLAVPAKSPGEASLSLSLSLSLSKNASERRGRGFATASSTFRSKATPTGPRRRRRSALRRRDRRPTTASIIRVSGFFRGGHTASTQATMQALRDANCLDTLVFAAATALFETRWSQMLAAQPPEHQARRFRQKSKGRFEYS